MKKIIRTLLVSLVAFICVYSVANAYEVKQGDTMWKISQNAGISLVQLIRNNPQVSNPDLIFPGQQINTGGSLLGATQRPSGYQTTLSQSLSETASTTEDIKVASLTTKDGHTLTTADVGNYIILTISPGKGNEEKVLCVGGTATSTRKWLTCTRGFNYYNQTYGTATVYPHSPGEIVIISDDDAYNATVYGYLSANNTWTGTNTSTGAWIFSNTNGMCLYNTNFCLRSNGTNIQWTENGWTDSYNFTSSSITQLTASTTAGIGVTDSKIYIKASSTLGGAFDDNGAYYQKTTTGLSNGSNGIGIDYANNNTWTGTNTFNGTTTLATMSATNGSINNLDITFNGTSFTKLTQGQALSIGDGTSVAINRDINITANTVKKTQIGDTQWVAWIFTTPDTGVTSTITTTTLKFNLTHSGSISSDNIILSIRSISGGSPTGSDLTSTTISGDVWGVTQGDRIFTVNFNYELTPNTQYALVVRLATNGDGVKSFYGNYLSTNSGSTWSAITGLDSAPSSDIRYNATITAGKLFPSSAYSINSGLKFVGFAGESVNNDSLISVITGFPVYYGASGLTSGSYYYLSDYPGVVSSTPGSVTKRIGIAVSSTSLKMDIID